MHTSDYGRRLVIKMYNICVNTAFLKNTIEIKKVSQRALDALCALFSLIDGMVVTP